MRQSHALDTPAKGRLSFRDPSWVIGGGRADALPLADARGAKSVGRTFEMSLQSADDLRTVRKRAHITQGDLGEKLGVSQKRISEIENRDIRTMRLSTIANYLDALGATMRITVSYPEDRDY